MERLTGNNILKKEQLMAAQDVSTDDMAAQDVPANGDAGAGRVMRGVDKAADVCLSGSMYIIYPAILLVIMIDVIGRNFFETPLSWAIEGSGLFLIGGIFLAVPRVELDKEHILLDILYARYPHRMKLICDFLTRAFAALWMLAATIRSAMEIPTSYAMRESGTDFRYPFWPMRVIMTLGFFVLMLALIYSVVHAYGNFRKGGR